MLMYSDVDVAVCITTDNLSARQIQCSQNDMKIHFGDIKYTLIFKKKTIIIYAVHVKSFSTS